MNGIIRTQVHDVNVPALLLAAGNVVNPVRRIGMSILTQKKICATCGEPKALSEFTKEKSSPDGYRYSCAECRKAQAREYYRVNKERYIENAKNWRKQNPEKTKIARKQSRQRNKEKSSIYSKLYRLLHRDQNNERKLKWYHNNKEKAAESKKRYLEQHPNQQREWRAKNPDKVVVYTENRRARIKGNGGTYTLDEWKSLCDRYGNKCLRCGRSDVKLTPDHVMPIAKGGSNSIDNIQPLCRSCNSWKNARYMDFRQF
jgi:hypothetical protein